VVYNKEYNASFGFSDVIEAMKDVSSLETYSFIV
jgi:hypothetical protein